MSKAPWIDTKQLTLDVRNELANELCLVMDCKEPYGDGPCRHVVAAQARVEAYLRRAVRLALMECDGCCLDASADVAKVMETLFGKEK